MKTNPIAIIGKKKEKKQTNVLDSRIQQIARYSGDARAAIEIGTVLLDGAMLYGYAKFCRSEFKDTE